MKMTVYPGIVISVLCILTIGCSLKADGPTVNVNEVYVFENTFNDLGIKSQPTMVELDADLSHISSQWPVYRMLVPNVNDTYARNLANKFGFVDEWPLVGKRTVYSYTNGSQSLEIGLQGSISFHDKISTTNSVPVLPNDTELVTLAKNWLASYDLYPANIIETKIGGGESRSSFDSQTKKAGPTVYYSKGVSFIAGIVNSQWAVPVAAVLLGDQGKIVQASVDNTSYKLFRSTVIKSPQAALDILTTYLARLTPVMEKYPECRANVDGTRVVINKVTIQDYIVPVYVFEGDAYTNPDNAVKYFRAMVDAVVHEN
jgi:hypothetical protein